MSNHGFCHIPTSNQASQISFEAICKPGLIGADTFPESLGLLQHRLSEGVHTKILYNTVCQSATPKGCLPNKLQIAAIMMGLAMSSGVLSRKDTSPLIHVASRNIESCKQGIENV